MTQSYPLHWPKDWSRTQTRKSSQFKTTLHKSVENVRESLRMFATDSGQKIDLTAVVISSNYGGGLSLHEKVISDPGVAVYFTWDGIDTCIAVDRYHKIEENLQAIHHCIEAERTKLRHGGLNLVRAAFRGYAALPPPKDSTKKPWHRVLDVAVEAPIAQCETAYKAKARAAHPDNGGSSDAMAELNAAIAEARASKRQ
jgi:hypothetical protein